MKPYNILLDNEAEDDRFGFYSSIAGNDSFDEADRMHGKLLQQCRSLSTLAERGRIPPELSEFGVTVFREIRFKPYRIFYSIERRTGHIHCILDWRADIQSVLAERLLR